MIFVCVGSRGYQFNRLLREMDGLVEAGRIRESVFAQIGLSDYEPVNYKYKRYMDKNEFVQMQREADLIVSHAGTGILIGALKLGKQVIAVPRRQCYGEHIDDHQFQIASVLEQQGYLRVVWEMGELGERIEEARHNPIRKKYEIKSNIVGIISDYIQKEVK